MYKVAEYNGAGSYLCDNDSLQSVGDTRYCVLTNNCTDFCGYVCLFFPFVGFFVCWIFVFGVMWFDRDADSGPSSVV